MLVDSLSQKKQTKLRSIQKKKLISDWILEFRFSSIRILSSLVGNSSPRSSSRFFKSLFFDKTLLKFRNSDLPNEVLVRAGSKFYANFDKPLADKLRWRDRGHAFASRQRILHDLLVQEVLLSYLPRLCEVRSEFNVSIHRSIKPDATVRILGCNTSIAIEFERSRKNRKEIYYKLFRYVTLLRGSCYSAVHFYFEDDETTSYYQSLFNAIRWPRVMRVGSKFRYSDCSESSPPLVHPNDPVRQAFAFRTFKRPQNVEPVISLGSEYEETARDSDRTRAVSPENPFQTFVLSLGGEESV